MSKKTALDMMISVRRELADGMVNVDFQRTPWGYRINWPNLNNEFYNISILTDNPSSEEIEEMMTWISENNNRVIIATAPSDKLKSQLDEELSLMKFGPEKVKAPFIEDMNIRNFSFDNRDIRIDHRKMTEMLSSFTSESIEEKIEIERLIGGILHMVNGKIWTLEDTNDNIVAAVVFSNFSAGVPVLEVVGSHAKMDPNKQFLKLLIGSTLETYGKSECLAYAYKPSWKYDLLTSLNFSIVTRFQRYQNLG